MRTAARRMAYPLATGAMISAFATAIAVSIALCAPGPGRAADLDVTAEAELGGGVDSNPDRVLGGDEAADGFASALARGRVRLSGESFRLSAQLTEAGRLYRAATGATAGASRLDASGQVTLSEQLSAGATLAAADLSERGHRLDQDALDAIVFLAWTRGSWAATGSGGWDVFAPRDAPLRAFLASGPRAALAVSWELVPGEAVTGSYDLALPSYPRWAEMAGTSRDDRTHTVSAEYVHRGAFIAALGYGYAWNRSSAAGGAFDRHRVTARVASYLPHHLTLAARGALQWSSYPEPLFLAEQLLLANGQQNLDSLELRLTHPLEGPLEIALGIAVYRAEAVLSGEAPSFTRGVLSLSVGWRGQWRSITGTP